MTHLSHRAEVASPSGIDRVDLMFARHFAEAPELAAAIHYGVRRPSVTRPAELRKVVARAEQRWSQPAAQDETYQALRRWLVGQGEKPAAPPRPPEAPTWAAELRRRTRIGRYKLMSRPGAPLESLYLNIAQHALERASHFAWLEHRPDVRAAFFVHDLIPLDYPEFWPAGHEELFERRIETMFRHARGLIASSRSVEQRVREEYARRGLTPVPILAQPLPSPLERADAAAPREDDPELAASTYFVMLGTIEPRKNHLLLLNLWRAMVERGVRPPKLALVGGRGWQNAETAALLDRSALLAPFVCEVAGLPDAALRRLLRHARALLAPAFAEGYGLPLVEALELGTPVLASDLPVFREATQERAIFLEPSDGAAWRSAISAMADRDSQLARSAAEAARAFRRPEARAYFACLHAFLADL